MTARCLPLEELGDVAAGGKARGLLELRRAGLRVPAAFVVVDATPDELPADLERAYAALGAGRVAVRSSALDEDSAATSFAGVHETLLGVEGIEALLDAVRACLQSLESEPATAYRERRLGGERSRMSVVVQRMVEARAAGVLFTADPVHGRRDRMIVDAVHGLGETLVSGRVTPDHFVLDRRPRVVHSEIEGSSPSISTEEAEALARDALRMEAALGRPLDMEWAIDADGEPAWLQARPITDLPGDVRELDSAADATHVYTTCNIGEMMPGAVTPLTWSLAGRAIDRGTKAVHVALGVYPDIDSQPDVVHYQFGHLFFDLTVMAAIGGQVFGSRPEYVCLAICGREIPEVGVRASAPLFRRAKNTVAMLRTVLGSSDHAEALDRLAAAPPITADGDSKALFRAIDARSGDLESAYTHHLLSSTRVGTAIPMLLRTIAFGREPTEADHRRVAELLAHADDVESHDVAAGIDRIVDALVALGAQADGFDTWDDARARAFLESPASSGAGEAYRRYLERHGHRAVREAELRQVEWAEDPSPVLDALRRAHRARRAGMAPRHGRERPSVPWHLRRLVTFAHSGVRDRERTKSAMVKVTTTLKRAYRELGRRLCAEGRLPDADLVYFLRHDEVRRFVLEDDRSLVDRARDRRSAFPAQESLQFDDVVFGVPEPIVDVPLPREGVLVGKTVSRGVVRGRARVARVLEEARDVAPGEILIAPITDVGWTPCFAVIAGLATDVGSAVSHGAVVAREYGLPAVVNLRTATRVFKTGDRVVLDADRGELRLDDD